VNPGLCVERVVNKHTRHGTVLSNIIAAISLDRRRAPDRTNIMTIFLSERSAIAEFTPLMGQDNIDYVFRIRVGLIFFVFFLQLMSDPCLRK
jgi:hypothetical protein